MSLSLPSGRLSTAASPGPSPALAVSPESLWLLAICFFDMVTSAYLFHHNLAVEANLVLRPFAEAGMVPFVLAKSVTFIPALLAAEWYRRRRPEFVVPLLRGAGILYTAIYSFCVVRQLWG